MTKCEICDEWFPSLREVFQHSLVKHNIDYYIKPICKCNELHEKIRKLEERVRKLEK